MQSLSASAIRTSGNSASRISMGTASSAFCAKLGLEHLGSREPILFTSPRVALISSVRAATNASRARNTTRSCRTSRLRCCIGCNDCGSTRPNRANLLASIRSFFRLRRFDPSINRGLATSTSCPPRRSVVGHQHFVPATADDFLHPGRVCPHLENHSRRIQCLKEFGNVLLRRTQLSLRQRFTLQTQNAVVAPLVPQIHTHRQTIEIGVKLPSRMLFSGARCCHLFRIQLFLQFSHQFRQHFLRIPPHRAPRLRRFRCRFTLLSRIVMLLQGRSPYPL